MSRTHFDQPTTRADARRLAFTLIELLVVITIIAVIVLVALPRFSTMIYAQEEQLAGSLLNVAMRSTRDAAIKSAGDEDAAAVFFWRYQPGGGNSKRGARLVIVPCIKVGTFVDDIRKLNNSAVQQSADFQGVQRDVFMPIEGTEPVVLPRNWAIRGYSPPNTVEGALGLGTGTPAAVIDPRTNWYEGPRYATEEGNWLFPETDFYPPTADRAGDSRQTFMVRFKAGTGEVVSVPNQTAIVVDVRPYYAGRDSAGPSTQAIYDAYDKTSFVKRVLREASPMRQSLFGRDASMHLASDVLLARPVSELALYDETKLAAALGAAIDPNSGCLYKPPPAIQSSDDPANKASSPEFLTSSLDSTRMNQWIEGDTNFDGMVESAGGRDHPLSRIFTLERYTGVPRQMEVQP